MWTTLCLLHKTQNSQLVQGLKPTLVAAGLVDDPLFCVGLRNGKCDQCPRTEDRLSKGMFVEEPKPTGDN
jgi:hypothetical protein